MKDRDVIKKRVSLERLKGRIIDEVYETVDDEDEPNGITYDDCATVLLQVMDLLEVDGVLGRQ